jgi:hypothetical protein
MVISESKVIINNCQKKNQTILIVQIANESRILFTTPNLNKLGEELHISF